MSAKVYNGPPESPLINEKQINECNWTTAIIES